MPKKTLPRIRTVTADKQPYTLRITWDRGEETLVDVSGLLETFHVYAPLCQSPALFRQVQVGEYGTDVVWPHDVDMAADTLWRLAQEQAGITMTGEAFHQWRLRHAYTLDQAANALGISRRMVTYYDHSEKPIPRVVALATKALDQVEHHPNP